MKKDLIRLLDSINSEFSGELIPVKIEHYANKLINNSKLFLEYDGNSLIGFIAFYANNEEDKRGYLSMLAIDKNYRGKGVAQLLLSKAIIYLQNITFEYFDLDVLKSNSKAIEFYKKNGFDVQNENETHFQMRKPL
ncbi:MAG: GNAT family N-acetyltransferase [Winogradskyella sp.]|uniref:GNAT family N-acetyltransferase n=1 Tax=Winogradskyella sp. TaxID=1883156 RepID=UPI000F41BFA2|nr:GNAT family N-acetyltransferase [Winogradskyella sp.]RNC86876.1 MAG: GNAT family N-acetyltransferase [Winogradskyella sp.]